MKNIIFITGVGMLLVGTFASAMFFGHGNKEILETKLDNQIIAKKVDAPDTNQDNYMPDSIDYVSVRPSVEALPAEIISESEKEGLIFMREEEKLARDVYMTLYEKWGLTIFSNIAQSEQTHTEAVRDLLVKYNITDPVVDDSIGVFNDEVLQKLYTDLVDQGMNSLEDALIVGAIIEDLDIFDLQQQMSVPNNADITLVYANLLRGSRNHMRAFISQIESRGASYEPQYIAQADYNEIISSARETGSGGGVGNKGNGAGRGWGN